MASIEPEVSRRLRDGLVIPAHPLALTSQRTLDERRQIALTRYYCAAGAGGLAIGVHTTQFGIRDPRVGLLAAVLRLGVETVREYERIMWQRIVMIAGVCGETRQAVGEAALARELGYDAGLLSLAAMAHRPRAELIAHCRAVAGIIPLFGFYLQPAVGGLVLDYEFWSAFLEIEAIVAIKIAPFNRYRTLDVIRAVAASGRQDEVALYTGNDDSVLVDLLTDFRLTGCADAKPIRFAGGLLGHWAFWTQRAVETFHRVRACRAESDAREAGLLLALSGQTTDANGAIFDARHDFAGCIPGIHEVLRRQGLLAGRWCLDPNLDLSPGQIEEIDRVCRDYPDLADDTFVKENLDGWLKS